MQIIMRFMDEGEEGRIRMKSVFRILFLPGASKERKEMKFGQEGQ